jgi:hypothetical protein
MKISTFKTILLSFLYISPTKDEFFIYGTQGPCQYSKKYDTHDSFIRSKKIPDLHVFWLSNLTKINSKNLTDDFFSKFFNFFLSYPDVVDVLYPIFEPKNAKLGRITILKNQFDVAIIIK